MAAATTDTILLAREGRDGCVAVVTINRPQVLNALDTATLDALERVVVELAKDERVRVVIITGAGEQAFVAGAHINELSAQTAVGARAHARAAQHVFDPIQRMGKLVLAAVNGYTLGGGR